MNKKLILGFGVLIAMSLVFIILFMPQIGTGDTIKVKNGDTFSVVLPSNPTTGYRWEVNFDFNYVQLTDSSYVTSNPVLVGSSGNETFEFLAVKSGETEMTFYYSRPWESKPPLDTRVFMIIIE
ncbi:MAG: protease inhibitor I42 family protein [Methanocellales archaeon]|nr:protease inhibitor I42 family protein [Methanocellales archaeon]